MLTPKRAYDVQRYHCKERGIEFQFTFEDWVNWWETHLGPNWLKRRGGRRGHYVMSRVGDRGPYKLGNVKCLLYEDNCRDQARNGKVGFYPGHMNYGGRKPGQGIKITADEAVEIYYATGTQKAIADTYGVSPRLVRLIKKRHIWRKILPS